MNILVEILHPAHVHVFRNAIRHWLDRGDHVLILSRHKECATELLDAYDLPHTPISRLGASKLSLAWELLLRLWRMLRLARRFKPDVLVGIMGVTIAPAGRLLRKPTAVFYDTENAGITNRFVYPLATRVFTPDCYQGRVNGAHETYPGYHELAYLHPDRFTPDPQIARQCGVDPQQPFFIVRFVSWQASHDIGEAGLTPQLKHRLVDKLAAHGRVLISSEGPLPDALEPLRFQAPPQQIHHVMAFATLLVGESATMASESAVLGVPALFISETGRGYTDEQEHRYGLVHNFKASRARDALDLLDTLLANPHLKSDAQRKRQTLLADKIDTTTWIIQRLDQLVDSSPNP